MIRTLKQNDYEIIRSYIDQDKLLNIHLDYWFQTFGLDNKDANFVGAIDGSRLDGVLLIANTYKGKIGYLGYPTSNKNYVLLELLKFGQTKGVTRFIGEKSNFEPALEDWRVKYRPRINTVNLIKLFPVKNKSNSDHNVRIVTQSEIPLLVELYKQYEYRKKNRSAEDAKQEIQNVMNESGVYFMIEVEGRAVSAIKIGNETDTAGIIGGARTLPEYRGYGMYLSLQTACLEYLSKKGKIGVGFVENKNRNMHKIQEKHGGSILNTWLIIDFGRNRQPARRRFIPLYLRRWTLNIKDRVLKNRT